MIDFITQVCTNISPMQAALVMALLILIGLIVVWARDRDSKNFKLVHMVSSTHGYPDNNKLWAWGAFFLSSYAFLWLLWNGLFTEWFFIGYMATWVGSAAYALKKRVESTEGPDVQSSSKATITETKTTRTTKK